MPLHVTKSAEQLPPETRNKKRSLEHLEEWLQLKTKLAHGLGKDEMVFVTFTPEQQKELRMKTLARTYRDMALEYIKELDLPYDVWRYRSEGKEVVVVAAKWTRPKRGRGAQ